MATVTKCELIEEPVSYGLDQTTIEAKYLVHTDAYVSPAAIKGMAIEGMPTGTSTHSVVTNAFVSAIKCDYRPGTGGDGTGDYLYDYEVTFTTPTPSQPFAPSADTEADPPQIQWGGADTTESVYIDQDGTPIENYAHQPYENQPTREAGDGQVTITRNEAANNAARWNAYSHSINSDVWFGNAATLCKMGRITAAKSWRNGVAYWKVSYPITFKEQGWRLTIDNVGNAHLESGKPVENMDELGNVLSKPVPLNADGSRRVSTATPRVLTNTHKLYKEKTWATLALPTPF